MTLLMKINNEKQTLYRSGTYKI